MATRFDIQNVAADTLETKILLSLTLYDCI